MKYIIDIPKTVGMTEKVGSVHYTYFDGIQCKTIILKSDDIEELNSDYINEHFSDLQDTAYQQGLEDAWEAARKIAQQWEEDADTEHRVVIDDSINVTLNSMTASEAIEKLKAYEEKQYDEIEVGDTVNLKDASLDKENGLVTKIWNNDYCYIVWSDGSGGSWEKNKLVKTGKHIDIASILEDMRND